MKRVVVTLLVVFGFLFSAATSQAKGTGDSQPKSGFVRLDRVTASRALPNGIELHAGTAIMQITALRDDIVRVRVGPAGQLPEDASWAVLPGSRTATVAVSAQHSGSSVGFKTAKLRVEVQKDPLAITVTDLDGHVIAEDLPGRPVEYHGASFRVYRKSPADEHYFGLGDKPGPHRPAQRGLHRLEYRCVRLAGVDGPDLQVDSLLHYVSAMALRRRRFSTTHGAQASTSTRNIATGIHLAPKRIARLLHPVWPGAEGCAGEVGRGWWERRLCLRCGASGISNRATAIIPRLRCGALRPKLRSERIPADVIWLDIDYQLKNRPFTVDPERFPHFDQMIKDLQRRAFSHRGDYGSAYRGPAQHRLQAV